jgi:hypothetical protein
MKMGIVNTREVMTEQQAKRFATILHSRAPDEVHLCDQLGVPMNAWYFLTHATKAVLHLKAVIHPPTSKEWTIWQEDRWKFKGQLVIMRPASHVECSRNIVDACDQLLAAIDTETEEKHHAGWAMIRYARKQNKPVTIVYPNGSVRKDRVRLPRKRLRLEE